MATIFEKPLLCIRDTETHVYVAKDKLKQFAKDLAQAGFKADPMKGLFGFEDVNADTRTDVVVVGMDPSVDRDALRRFLREWTS